MRSVRLPVQPLLDYCCDTYQRRPHVTHIGPVGIAAHRLDVSCTTIYRWMNDGIPLYKADRLAVKQLGVHPAQIWNTWHINA